MLHSACRIAGRFSRLPFLDRGMAAFRLPALLVATTTFASALSPTAFALDQSAKAIRADPARVPGVDGSGVNIGQRERGHPNENHVSLPAGQMSAVNPLTPNSVSDHATGVAGVILSQDARRKGVAPGTSVYSFADDASTAPVDRDQFFVESIDALLAADSGKGVKIVNHSAGFARIAPLDGLSAGTLAVDWLANRHDAIFVQAAGNDGPGSSSLGRPADCYNCIVVGGTNTMTPGEYNVVRRQSSEGSTADLRNKPDIVAPGQAIDAPTGTGPGASGFRPHNGTSFAAPHVSGVAALLTEFANERPRQCGVEPVVIVTSCHTDDHRVIKAVLLNSAMKDGAEKTLEYQVLDKQMRPWLPAQPGSNPLDDQMGAGQVNAAAAFTQFTPPQRIDLVPSPIEPIAWHRGQIAGGARNTYLITKQLRKGSKLTATLVWDRHVTRVPCIEPCESYEDRFVPTRRLANLDMVLLREDFTEVRAFDARGRASFSESLRDSVEHIYFDLPDSDFYAVRIRNRSQLFETYGLAVWSHPLAVPEPPALVLMLFGLVLLIYQTGWMQKRPAASVS